MRGVEAKFCEMYVVYIERNFAYYDKADWAILQLLCEFDDKCDHQGKNRQRFYEHDTEDHRALDLS